MGFWDVMKELGEYGWVPPGLLYRWFGPEPYFESPRPEAIDFSQSKIGTPLPLTYGTIRVDNPVLYWHGNQKAVADGGGFNYAIDMLVGVGVPSWDEAAAPYSNWRATYPPKLLRFWYGDQMSFAGVPVNLEHGGDGTVGVKHSGNDEFFERVEFFDGRRTQLLTDSPAAYTHGAMVFAGADPDLIPGYRHQMLVGIVDSSTNGIGHSPHVASMGFEIQSLGPQPIESPNGNGSFDANPAWVLYDLLCGKVWKIGFNPDRMDLASFQYAADVLVAEGHGGSYVIYQSEPAVRVLGAICSQINGLLFEDPSTGLLKLTLIRKNYLDDHSGLKRMTKDNTVGRPKVTMVGSQDTKNHVTLHFTNRDREYHPDVVIDQRLAMAVGQNNRRRPVEPDMPGITNNVIAAKTASRELAVVSRPLITATATLNREFYDTLPGVVLVADWPDLQVEDVPMRVFNVGLGQRAKGEIRVVLIEDVFDHGGAGFTPPVDDTELLNVIPLTERLFDEAPFYLINELYLTGAVPNTDQRVMALAVMEGIANRFRDDTQDGFSADDPNFLIHTIGFPDVPAYFANATAKVATAYSRNAEPYDTTTGLVIDSISDNFIDDVLQEQPIAPPDGAVENAIRHSQFNLILVVPAGQTTGGEFMSFESITDNLDGTYTLNRVWRGLMDTAPVDHAIGARIYWVDLNTLGRRAWGDDFWVRGSTVPMRFALEEPIAYPDDIRVALRGSRPARLADLVVAGYEATGTSGVPAVAAVSPRLGHFKEVTELDGALDVTGRERNIEDGEITRGNDTGWVSTPGTTYDIHAQKGDEDEVVIVEDLPNFFDPADDLSNSLTKGVLLGRVGHGDVDLIVHTMDGGLQSWQSPRIRVAARRYRNLLANGSFEYGALLPGWVATAGDTFAIGTGTESLPRSAGGRWIRAASGEPCTLSQTVDVTGYKPTGLAALVTLYARTFDGELAQSVTITITALDADDNVVDSDTSSSLEGTTGKWRRHAFSFANTSTNTAKLKVSITFSDTAVGVTRVRLQLGQVGNELLTNPSFDGNTTGWSTADAPFNFALVHSAAIPYATDNGTDGAAAAPAATDLSGLKQTVAIPAGYEYGTFVVEYAQAHRSSVNSNADEGVVVASVLDGGGSVLASTSSGSVSHNTAMDVWHRHRVAVDLVDGAVSVRVEVKADRNAGSGDCAILFDDLTGRIHKHLDASHEFEFDFGNPARAHAPNSWQAFHLAYPALAIPVVFGGTSSVASVQRSDEKTLSRQGWSDASADSAHLGIFRGYFDIFAGHETGVGDYIVNDDLDCYVFNGALPIIVSGGLLDDNYGKFTAADSFTVAVLLRSTDIVWAGATGLVGRRNSSDIGWEIQLDATGKAKVVFKGASSEVSATSADVVCDRSPRWVFMRCDGTNMKVYTKAGNAGTSLAGLGSTDVSFVDLGIGRGAASSNVFRGQIARVYIWDSALAEADIQAMVNEVGADPSELLTSFTSDQPVWVPGTPSSTTGATLVRCATSDVPIAYDERFAADGDAYGLAITHGNKNEILSFDVTDTSKWGQEAGSFSIDRAVVDPTGLPRGVQITQNTAGAGFRITDMVTPLVSKTWGTIVYLRGNPASPLAVTVNVQMLDSNGVSMGTVACVVDSKWKRFEIAHTWIGSTPTAHLRFVLATGTGTYGIGHVVWSGEGPDIPIAIQDANTTIAQTHAKRDTTLPVQLIREGELEVNGLMPIATSARGWALIGVDNDTADLKNKRILGTETSPTAVNMSLYNASGAAPTNTETPISSWSAAPWTVRGRWNSLALPEENPNVQGVRVDGESSLSSGAAFTVDANPLEVIRLGGGDASGSSSANMLIRRAVVRAREKRLTGE